MRKHTGTLILIFLSLAVPARAGELGVVLRGVRDSDGLMHVAVCTEDTFETNECEPHENRVAEQGDMVFRFDLPPGDYAVQVYHDENGNNHLDRGFLGLIPDEGYAISRHGRLWSSPDFDESSVQVGDESVKIEMPIIYP